MEMSKSQIGWDVLCFDAHCEDLDLFHFKSLSFHEVWGTWVVLYQSEHYADILPFKPPFSSLEVKWAWAQYYAVLVFYQFQILFSSHEVKYPFSEVKWTGAQYYAEPGLFFFSFSNPFFFLFIKSILYFSEVK